MLLAELQASSGYLGGAIKALAIAIERFPYIPAPYEKLADCYQRAGETAKASVILRRGLRRFPADKNLLQLAAKTGLPQHSAMNPQSPR